jgi:hypothetical protein
MLCLYQRISFSKGLDEFIANVFIDCLIGTLPTSYCFLLNYNFMVKFHKFQKMAN